MPYLSTELRPQGELLSGYSLLDDTAAPQRDGGDQRPDAERDRRRQAARNSTTACSRSKRPRSPTSSPSGRFTWRAYMEGMADPATGKPGNCVYPGAEEPYPPAEGGYTATRNPFVYFHSLLDLGDCAANDLPLTSTSKPALSKADATAEPLLHRRRPSATSGSTVECPEGQTGGPAAADAFLAEWVPKILASPAYKKDGLLIVTFDSARPGAGDAPGVPAAADASRKVGTLLVSRFLSPGSTDAKPYDPYSLLRSTEDMFGLSTPRRRRRRRRSSRSPRARCSAARDRRLARLRAAGRGSRRPPARSRASRALLRAAGVAVAGDAVDVLAVDDPGAAARAARHVAGAGHRRRPGEAEGEDVAAEARAPGSCAALRLSAPPPGSRRSGSRRGGSAR